RTFPESYVRGHPNRLEPDGGTMKISSAIAQLRTTDLAESIRFYTTKIGLTLEFQYQDFYAGIRAGGQLFHLKFVEEKDPSIEFVDKGGHFNLYLETDDASTTPAPLTSNAVPLLPLEPQTDWGTP